MGQPDGLMRIGQAAGLAGVATHTLRYYEREGIVHPRARSPGGYRLYDGETVERLRFIRSAQAIGFTLDDIRALLALNSPNAAACQRDVQPLLEQRLGEVNDKIKKLKQIQKTLARALDECRRSSGACAVLRNLRAGAGPSSRPGEQEAIDED